MERFILKRQIRKHRYKIIALIIVIVAGIYGYATKEDAPPRQEGTMRVHFIDVGEGDSAFIEFPDGKTMLIDAGEVKEGETVLSYIQSCGVERVDFLVGTHPHSDHIGGLETIVRNLEIGEVYMPKVTHNTKTFENLFLSIQEKGLKVKPARAGMDIYNEGGVRIKVIAPIEDEYDNLNNYSVVLEVTYNDTSFLFTGDAENEVLEELHIGGEIDVLKVSHHGSYTSGSELFMNRVSPEYAVISVGARNQYGHPHREVMEFLSRNKIKVYRTDENGTVIAESDGEKITIRGSRD